MKRGRGALCSSDAEESKAPLLVVLFRLGLARMPRLWLGPSRLWLSQTSGRALAIKDSLAPARLGWGHGL